jgi:hypothetical protein
MKTPIAELDEDCTELRNDVVKIELSTTDGSGDVIARINDGNAERNEIKVVVKCLKCGKPFD